MDLFDMTLPPWTVGENLTAFNPTTFARMEKLTRDEKNVFSRAELAI
jgi:hypothetical protein